MTSLRLLLALALIPALAACGQSHEAGLGDASPDDAAPFADATPDGGGSVDGSTTVDAGGPADGATTTDGGGASDGGTVTDGGTVVDAATPTVDAGTTRDSGPGVVLDGSTGRIECGSVTCDGTTEQCCIEGGGGGATASCIAIGDACMGAAVDCDGPEDCPGDQVCCATGSLGGATVECTDASMCGGGFTSFEVCHDVDDCTDGADMCCPFMGGGISASICSARCFGAGGF